MLLNDETQKKIDGLPIVLKTIANTLLECVSQIINGKCNEESLVSTFATLNQNSKGRYSKDDLLNYDQVSKVLGILSRCTIKQLLDRHGIKEVVMNNMKCGFPRSEIMALRDKLADGILYRQKRMAIKNRVRKKISEE